MRYMTWSGGWGNLRYANNAALVALAWAAQQPAGTVSGGWVAAGGLVGRWVNEWKSSAAT